MAARSRRRHVKSNRVRRRDSGIPRVSPKTETVYVSPPAYSYEHNEKEKKKGFLHKLIGDKFKNDDLVLILLIGIIFLTKNNKEDESGNYNTCESSNEKKGGLFGGADILSSVTGILDRFSDSDLLLFALLYILL